MTNTISQLEPRLLWKHFHQLTQIPRPSGHEQQVIWHIEKFAIQKKLEYSIDSTGNIVVRKNAKKGKEHSKKTILQSHVDMVPQKNSEKIHDFVKDPIETHIVGDWVFANKTTLGADNGIGVAAILAILESNTIDHGAIEALFTVSEETGMDGAFGLDSDFLKGDILLNLDSEDEGEVFIGCAGGLEANISFDFTGAAYSIGETFQLSISGLKGGHSGIDINLGRANANILMAQLLDKLCSVCSLQLISFKGGNLRNAIPREAIAELFIPKSKIEQFTVELTNIAQQVKSAYRAVDPDILITSIAIETSAPVMENNTQQQFIKSLLNCPNGVVAMSNSFPDKVETSNNISIVNCEKGKAEVKLLLRSANDTEKIKLSKTIEQLFTKMGAKIEFAGNYPGWDPNINSYILKKSIEVYRQLYGIEPKVNVIHAGLECGIIGAKYPGLDMLSFGPTIKHPHSPDEKVQISSVEKFWIFLVGLVENV